MSPGWLSVFAVTLLLAAPNVGRANPGDLDATFGTGGTVTTAFGTSSAWARGVALQGGKIVAVGYANNDTQGVFALARYNPDGSLDATFGAGGTVTTAIGTISDFANAVAVQGDGKIVAAGSTDTGTQNVLGYDQTVFALAR